MYSKAMAVVVTALLAVTPVALCSCGNQKPTTADSAGTPSGWSGRKINMNNPKGGPTQPAPPAGSANK